ncbi:hypothetical protein [Nocardioides nanhaiensis]|uniref:Uncharacterized protein n=1 Tax=Nocardioides nanhaiensis TaxID=1476871 RepID=A0ABP8VRA1_9ACTN
MAHRAKTHLGYTVFQTGPAAWIWGTPNGPYRLVDHRGTHHLTQTEFRVLRDHAIDASEYRPVG